ncbi:hypothetical protein [Nocardia brasiliensis]|uniref:hypothetical protein n=1 Tax=Nocardia brasiliensis TaxID=37326 RepID=UPI0024550340|nr:hypothetical protein [Nocardia brasiliensis]
MQLDWGTVPAWVSAAGTLITAGSAAMAYTTYRNALEDRRSDQERQARLITPGLSAMGGVLIEINNRSPEPITEVAIERIVVGSYRTAQWRPNRRVMGGGSGYWDVVEKGAEAKLAVEFVDQNEKLINFMAFLPHVDTISVTVRFTDRAGRRWRRTDLDRPTRVYN